MHGIVNDNDNMKNVYTLISDRDSNETREQVGQQRNRKLLMCVCERAQRASDCFASIKRCTKPDRIQWLKH